MHRSVPNKTKSSRKNNAREIVDPTAWEFSEVVGKEAAVFHAVKNMKQNKVSSIRSSLFQKNAKGMAQSAKQHVVVDDNAAVFISEEEAASLQAPFIFQGTSCLEFCAFGKPNKKLWAKDILGLVHNAVRSELKDLSIILLSVQKLGYRLRVGDFVQVRKWWQTCSGIVLDFLDLEMKHLIPWYQFAAESVKTNDKVCLELLATTAGKHKDLRDLVMNISKSFGDICDPPAINQAKLKQETSTAKKAMLVVNSLDVLISQVCEYMWEHETRLPSTLTSVYKSEKREREVIMTTIIKYVVRSSRKSETMLVLFTRWMIDSKALKSFLKVLKDVQECNYSELQSQFEVNHASFVHQFSVKAGI